MPVRSQDREHGAHERGSGESQERAGRPPESHGQDGAQGRAGAHAQQPSVGHRVAEYGLERRAHDGEPASHQCRKQHTRQSHRPQHGFQRRRHRMAHRQSQPCGERGE
jgi:hypothetical protein